MMSNASLHGRWKVEKTNRPSSHTHTFLAWSLSSIWPRSLPLAWAILFPDTRLPTMTDAGPISGGNEWQKHGSTLRTGIGRRTSRNWGFRNLPGCFCRGLGRLITQVCGHMSTLQGCSAPSRNSCLVSDKWMPPRGVFGRVLEGTRARQYTPTWCMLSIAFKR